MIRDMGLNSSNNLLLQIDVEGAEWQVFKAANAEDWKHFSQILVEFHGILPPNRFWRGPLQTQLHALQNLLQHFTVLHTHGNNAFCGRNGCRKDTAVGKFHIPFVLEVLFVRNDLVKQGRCVSSANRDLDLPNEPRWSDVAPPHLPGADLEALAVPSTDAESLGSTVVNVAPMHASAHE